MVGPRAESDHHDRLLTWWAERAHRPYVGSAQHVSTNCILRAHGGVGSRDRDQPWPPYGGSAMADKSPRQGMTKQSGKSLKEKRAEKRAKGEHTSSTEAQLHFKKH